MNPTGWQTPKTDWLPDNGITHVDINRIEANILGLRWFSDTFDAKIPTPYFSAEVVTEWSYFRQDDLVTISIGEMASPGDSNNSDLQIAPDSGTWPALITPVTDIIVPCVLKVEKVPNSYYYRPGFFIIPSVGTSNIICYVTQSIAVGVPDELNANGAFVDDGFSLGGGGAPSPKTIPAQTISYIVG